MRARGTPKQESRGVIDTGRGLENLHKNMNRLTPYLLLAAGVAAPAVEELKKTAHAAQMPKADLGTASMRTVPVSEQRTVEWNKIRPLYSWVTLDKNGDPKFDLLAAISLGVEIPTTLRFQKLSTGELPSQYARKFARDRQAGRPVREEDRRWLADEVQYQLRETFADLLHSWDITGGGLTESVHRYAHRTEKAPKLGERVRAIYMEGIGGASPEGPQEKGPQTISWGSVDPENIDLAMLRAGNLDTAYRQAFTRESVAHPSKAELTGREYGYSKKELQILETLSKEYPGDTVEEKIFNLHVAYNRNALLDASAKPILDYVVGRKRNAREIVEYEGNRKETYVGSFPLLLLLLPKLGDILLRRLKRRQEGKPPREASPKPLRKLPEKPRLPEVPDAIRLTKLPPLGSKEYEDMRERVLLEDFDLFFRHKQTEQRGIHYENLVKQTRKELRGKAREYKAIDEIELALAKKILDAWEAHDRKANPNVSYQNDPRQIQEARVHAQVIVDLALKQNEKPFQNITATLDEIVRPYKHREGSRRAKQTEELIKKTGKPYVE